MSKETQDAIRWANGWVDSLENSAQNCRAEEARNRASAEQAEFTARMIREFAEYLKEKAHS